MSWPYLSFDTFFHGEFVPTGTASQFPNIPCAMVRFKATKANTGTIYIGSSSAVTYTNNVTDTNSGFELGSLDDSGWIPVKNLNVFWAIGTVATDSITYWAFGVN